MNRTRLLMIGVLALGLGLFVSMYVYKSLQAKSGAGGDPGVDVMVAANDLQVGARVEEHDIKIIRIPGGDLPPGAPRKRSEVVGHGVIIPISRGEFILPNRLAPENAGSGLPSLIPPGMRAVSVRVNEIVSVAGFVTPGTRVDVLLTGTPGNNESADNNGAAECSSHRRRSYSGTHGHWRAAEHTGDYASGFSRRCATADSCQLRRPHSTGLAQSARHSPGRVSRSSAKGLYKGMAPRLPCTPPVHRVPSTRRSRSASSAPTVGQRRGLSRR